MLPTNKLFILILPVLFEAPRAQDLGEMPLPRHYERLVLNWLKSVEGEPQSAPYKKFRQFYFGSLLDDSNTFPREWPHVHFGPGSGAEMTLRTAVTDGGVLAVKEFADGAPGLIDGGIRFGTRPGSEGWPSPIPMPGRVPKRMPP